LLVSLSASVLCKAATKSDMQGPFTQADGERFMREAKDCFACAHIPGLNIEIAQGLEAAGHELWALAVDIEMQFRQGERNGVRKAP